MITTNPVEKDSVVLTLDTSRLVADANIELLQSDLLLIEQLHLRMQIAQSYLNELDLWEKWGDQKKYDDALDSAKIAAERVQGLVNQILNQEYKGANSDDIMMPIRLD